MKVTVKRKHIRLGQPENALACPIGISLQEKFGNVVVNTDTVVINGLEFDLAAQARLFIERFDKGEPVKPFSFELKTLWK